MSFINFNKNFFYPLILLILIGVYTYIISSFYFKIQPQTAIVFKNLEFNEKNTEISFGANNNIIYPSLPDSICTLKDSSGYFNITFSKPIYTKVNGKTLNKYPLILGKNQQIIINDSIVINAEELISKIKKKERTYYFLTDSLIFSNSSNLKGVKSLITAEKQKKWGVIPTEDKRYSIILLDTLTKVQDSDYIERQWNPKYVDTLNKNEVKLHFFKVTSSKEYKDNELMNYIRVTPLRTNFRATHTLIRRKVDDNSEASKLEVSFSHDYRIVLSDSIIERMYEGKGSTRVNIDNDIHSVSRNDIYVDPFSDLFSSKIAYIDFEKDKENKVPNVEIFSGSEEKSSFLFKTFRTNFIAESFKDEDVTLHFYADHLDWKFFTIPIAILIFTLIFFGILIYKKDLGNLHLYNSEYQINASDGRILWRHHHFILLCCLGVFLLLKMLVAYKLSFTYPYYNYSYHTALWILALLPVFTFIGWFTFYKINNTTVKKIEQKFALKPLWKTGGIILGFGLIILSCFLYLWHYGIRLEINRYVDIGNGWEVFKSFVSGAINDDGSGNHMKDKNNEVIVFTFLMGLYILTVFPLFNLVANWIRRINKYIFKRLSKGIKRTYRYTIKKLPRYISRLYKYMLQKRYALPFVILVLVLIFIVLFKPFDSLLLLGLLLYIIFYSLTVIVYEKASKTVSIIFFLIPLGLLLFIKTNLHSAISSPTLIVICSLVLVWAFNKGPIAFPKNGKTLVIMLLLNFILPVFLLWGMYFSFENDRFIFLALLGMFLVFIGFTYWKTPFKSTILWGIPVICIIPAILFSDNGYLITIFGILLALVFVSFLSVPLRKHALHFYSKLSSFKKIGITLLVAVLLLTGTKYFITNIMQTDEDIEVLTTSDRRFSLFIDFEKYRAIGTRKTEGDTEFFANMAHYGKNAHKSKPVKYGLLDQEVDINSNISLPGYPIATNDLNPLVGLIGPLGKPVVIILFLVWGILLYMPLTKLINAPSRNAYHNINLSGIIRLFAACVLVGSSFYMLMALMGKLPFTGRLIYGLGVDSVAEPIETMVLFILMGLKLHHHKSKTTTNEV